MIEKISDNVKAAIIRKTPIVHGTRPSEAGMPAEQVKKMFYTAIVDEANSVLSEMERMRVEANADLDARIPTADRCDDVEGNVDSHHVPTTLGLYRYAERLGNVYRLFFTHLVVKPADWQQLEAAVGTYTYRAAIPLAGVSVRMVPELCFAPSDAVRSQLATFCHTYEGGVYVYSTEALSSDVTVESLICSLPVFYTVEVDAPHADVHIVDASGKTYVGGDPVAVGAHLTITPTAHEGYNLRLLVVDGQTCLDASASVTVSGTVQVRVTTEVAT